MRFKSTEELQKWAQRNQRLGQEIRSVKPTATPAVATVDPHLQRRILGIDTALRTTGWGLVDIRGQRLKAVDCGVIRTPQKEKISECLRRLAGGIRELVQLYHPDIAVLEGAFFCKNVRTSMMLGSARGAVIAVLAELGIDIFEYAPRRVKESVCGNGNASKQQVALLVSQLLGINTANLILDSTDALAMAITHAQNLSTVGGLGLPERI